MPRSLPETADSPEPSVTSMEREDDSSSPASTRPASPVLVTVKTEPRSVSVDSLVVFDLTCEEDD